MIICGSNSSLSSGSFTVNSSILFSLTNENSVVVNSSTIVVSNSSSNLVLTSSNIIFSDGTYRSTSSLEQIGFANLTITNTQTFTTSSTWVKPNTGKIVIARLWGAGGSGGAISVQTTDARANNTTVIGGAGGAFSEMIFAMSSLPENVAVTIGTGGTSVIVDTANTITRGLKGGDTSFGCYFNAGGGYGGGTYADNVSGGYSYVTNNQILVIPHITYGFNGSTNTTQLSTNSSVIQIRSAARSGFPCDKIYGGGGEWAYCSVYGGGTGGGAAACCGGGVSCYGGQGGSGAAWTGTSNTCSSFYQIAALPGSALGGGGGSAMTLVTCTIAGTATSGEGGRGHAIVYVYG